MFALSRNPHWVLDFIVELPWKHCNVQYEENVFDTLTENIYLVPYENGAHTLYIQNTYGRKHLYIKEQVSKLVNSMFRLYDTSVM